MMNNLSQKQLSILHIGQDMVFANRIKALIMDRFQIEYHYFDLNELRKMLRISYPILLVWDCSQGNPPDSHLINWLRDHFQGRPILAMVDERAEEMIERLHHGGVNFILHRSHEDFDKELFGFIKLILSDLQIKCA